jgi:ubiquinone/menaquinone biosynthesis C-methylase UbiE
MKAMHEMWASVAPGWREHADFVDARGADVTARMLELTAPQPGDRVLELACGPGGVGLAVAPLVDPGDVVISDVADEMLAIAAERASQRGLANLSARTLDVEDIDEPDDSFELVLCREGLMFADDHARAAGEISRVLRPGGRAAIAVWGPRERNPWLGLVMDAVSEQTGFPVPPPGVHGPFALDDADRFAGALTDGGLTDIEVTELPVPLRAGSFEEWWRRTGALAGPLSKIMAALPEEAREGIERRLRAAVRPYEADDGLELPGATLVASARCAPV